MSDVWVVFFDALRVKIRGEATVRSEAAYLALAILPDGSRDILGIWIEHTEGAKFWMKVFAGLKTRGCHDILIAVTAAPHLHGGKGRAAAAALEVFERNLAMNQLEKRPHAPSSTRPTHKNLTLPTSGETEKQKTLFPFSPFLRFSV